MEIVFLTAIGVGGATVLGALIGFLFKKIPHRFNDAILGFAAGVMLAAAFFGLILPSIEGGEAKNILIASAGIFSGAFFLSIIDKLTPHLHSLAGVHEESSAVSAQLNKVMLFVFAIAIHNLPEGIAAGVSFGGGRINEALSVAAGIALQNIPEGMIIIAPMLSAGVSRSRTFLIALATGLVEVAGTFLGFFAVSISQALLPFALAFAGGTMIYVISDEMIPETHSHGYEKSATYALLSGFCLMLMMDTLIGG